MVLLDQGAARGPPTEGFAMGCRTQDVQEILKYTECPLSQKSELGEGTQGAGPLRVVLNSNSVADNV